MQCTLSSEFWKKARHHYSLIDSDNTLKWLQFRVVRNCLPTNKIVCKFVNNVQPICSFCLDPSSLELISHIYWHCPKIKTFLHETAARLEVAGIGYEPTKLQFLFGFHEKAIYDPHNFITLLLKKYIWSKKFKNCRVSYIEFKSKLKFYAFDLSRILEIKGLTDNSELWNSIALSL